MICIVLIAVQASYISSDYNISVFYANDASLNIIKEPQSRRLCQINTVYILEHHENSADFFTLPAQRILLKGTIARRRQQDCKRAMAVVRTTAIALLLSRAGRLPVRMPEC